MQQAQAKNGWRGVKKIARALELIDMGVILHWKEVRPIMAGFTHAEHVKMVTHLAQRLAERIDDRLATEIAIETLLCVIGHAQDEKLLEAFFEELFLQGNAEEACRNLVEIACTSEATDLEYDDDLFSIAVVLICELGIALRDHEESNPGDFNGLDTCLDHIATYLLSISNCNNHCVRLSLISYFAKVNDRDREQSMRLNKILHRFGQTVLDGLMSQLFDKKSEAMALQFLLENLPFWFEADVNVQRIIHESFKHYMLKHPDRFVLFLQSMASQLANPPSVRHVAVRRVYAQHLGALFQVADEVGHRALGRDILLSLLNLRDRQVELEMLHRLKMHPSLRGQFREMVASALVEEGGSVTAASAVSHAAKTKGAKRGRKPSINRSEGVGTMEQVAFLGARLAKVS